MWVTVDKAGKVIDSAETLPELTGRAGKDSHRLTFVFAAGTRREREAAPAL